MNAGRFFRVFLPYGAGAGLHTPLWDGKRKNMWATGVLQNDQSLLKTTTAHAGFNLGP